MQLLITNGAALGKTPIGKAIAFDPPTPAAVAAYFSDHGFRPLAARAVAYGALRERESAIELGRAIGLLAGGSVWSGRQEATAC